MLFGDPHSTLLVVEERGRQFRAEAAAGRLRGRKRTRRVLAESLRRAADRLDPAPFAARPSARQT